jgi:hypothetical protein
MVPTLLSLLCCSVQLSESPTLWAYDGLHQMSCGFLVFIMAASVVNSAYLGFLLHMTDCADVDLSLQEVAGWLAATNAEVGLYMVFQCLILSWTDLVFASLNHTPAHMLL